MNTAATAILAVLGPKYRLDQDGDIEKLCQRCRREFGEEDAWWPATLEYFPRDGGNGPGKLHSWCRACNAEVHQERRNRQARAAVVEAPPEGAADILFPWGPPRPTLTREERGQAAAERRKFNIELGKASGAYDEWRRRNSKFSGGNSMRFNKAITTAVVALALFGSSLMPGIGARHAHADWDYGGGGGAGYSDGYDYSGQYSYFGW